MTVENPSIPQESVKLLRTLNTIALALQESTGTIETISTVFKTKLEAEKLGGAIILLDDPDHWVDNPDATATILTSSVSNPTVRKIEKKLGISANNLKFKLSNAIAMQNVLRTQKAQFIADSQALSAQYLPPIVQPFAAALTRSFKDIPTIMAPLFKGKQVIGILPFSIRNLSLVDIPAIEIFAHHISIAMENTRLIQDLRAEITHRENVEASLLVSKTRYHSLIENIPVPVAIHNGETLLFINKSLKTWLKITDRSQIIGKSIWQFVAPASQSIAKHRTETVLAHGIQTKPTHEQFIRPNGEIRDVEVVGNPINYEGKPASLNVFHDISTQKEAQSQLEHHLTQLTLLNEVGLEISKMLNLDRLFERTAALIHQKFGYHHVAIFIRNDEENTLFMKARAGAYAALFPEDHSLKLDEGMVGWAARHNQSLVANDITQEPSHFNPLSMHPNMKTRAELSIPLHSGGTVYGVLDIQSPRLNAFDEQQVMVLETLAQQISIAAENAQLYYDAKVNLEVRSQTADILAQHNQDLIFLNRIISIAATDQTYTQKLHRLCEEFSHAFELSHVVIGHFTGEDFSEVTISTDYRTDLSQTDLSNQKITLHPTSRFPMWLQYSTEPLVVTDIEDDPHIKAARPLIQGLQLKTVLFLHLRTDEKMPFLLAAGSQEIRTFSDNELSLATRMAEQVSSILKHLQLEQTQARLSTAVDQSTEGLIITDTKGVIVYCNAAFGVMSGFKRSELLGKHMAETTADNRERMMTIISHLQKGESWEGNLRQLTKNGEPYVAETSVIPVKSDNGDIENYIVTQRDITQRLELEEQLRQSQKMEAVGQLAAGIAHDFNNMLTAINGFSELLISRTHTGSAEQDYAFQILESGNRAADLVSQLLAYSRKQLISPKVINLNQSVLNLQQFLRRVINENVQIDTNLAPDLNSIRIDPSQLEQVVMNLCINAGDAMPNGGTLMLRTANVFLDSTYAASHPETDSGDYVLLSVSDTGEGINETIQSHIFDPFFTTKEMGKGTGLGLATVYGIVKQNKGDIELKSETGVGSTFNVYLPATAEISEQHSEDTQQSATRGKETILLVEDSDNVLDLVHAILDELGYRLLHAKNGQEAIKKIKDYPDKIDLLLTDVMMPHMDGKHLANYLRQNNPAQKVLFISGYDLKSLGIDAEMAQKGTAFLPKPFTASALATAVRDLLDL